MTEEELRIKWTELYIEPCGMDIHSPKLIPSMINQIKIFDERIRNRDRREIISGAAQILLFIAVAYASSGYERIGALLLVSYFVWIIFYLVRVRVQHTISLSESMKDQLVSLKKYVVAQRNLVGNVLYWYLLPILPGVLFFVLGMQSPIAIVLVLVCVSLGFTYVYRLNRRASRENYDHLLASLEEAIMGLRGS